MSRFKARPTVYKGIQMRSRLEAGFAAWLDGQCLQWQYEPFAVAGPEGQYLPDFVVSNLVFVTRGAVVPTFIEVKPDSFKLEGSEGERLARSMALVGQNVPSSLLVVVQPGRVTQVRQCCPEECDDDHPFGCDEGGFGPQLRWVASGAVSAPLGLARLLPDTGLPWADEYWKVD